MQYTRKTQEIIIRQTYIGQEVQSCQHLQKLPPCVPSQLPLFLFPHEEASLQQDPCQAGRESTQVVRGQLI